MEKNGFIIIKNAIKNPNFRLNQLRKDNRTHSKVMWRLRFEVKKYYEYIWNTKNLVCCFGGNMIDDESLEFPWHVDQNCSHEKGLVSVQGILALTKSNSTQLLKGSHKYFESMSYRCTKNNPYEWESDMIPDDDFIWKKGLEIVVPKLNAGDLLIFDSRLVHRVVPKNRRSIVYISMVPRNHLSNLIERLRKKAYKENWTTTHWCSKLIKIEKDDEIQDLKYNELV